MSHIELFGLPKAKKVKCPYCGDRHVFGSNLLAWHMRRYKMGYLSLRYGRIHRKLKE